MPSGKYRRRELLSTPSLTEAWTTFKTSQSAEARDRLIIHYSPLVKYVVGRVERYLPSEIDERDLVSLGMFGLIDAIDKYNLDSEVRFETYAISRIRSAIVDELHAIDWISGSVRDVADRLMKVTTTLESKLNRFPSDAEIAEEMKITLDELKEMYSELSTLSLVVFEDLSTGGTEDADETSLLGDMGLGTSEFEKLKVKIRGAVARLSEREKVVLTLYYSERMGRDEIAHILGISVQQVRQLHARALLLLKSEFETRIERDSGRPVVSIEERRAVDALVATGRMQKARAPREKSKNLSRIAAKESVVDVLLRERRE